MDQANLSNKNPKRLLGIDYGLKRVGVAVTDESGKFALPVSVIVNSDLLVAEVEKIAIDNGVKEIILGESRNYSGEPNTILLDSMEFKKQMEDKGFTVIFEPEFMTSMQATRLQGNNDMKDASAAALILQSYIDREKVK